MRRCQSRRWILFGLCFVAVHASRAADDGNGADTEQPLRAVTVTATRIPEPVGQIPASISTVSGDELRARNAWDLASALSLVSGVEAPVGGDAGPSSAVPAFWGLHEFDAFLLVVDGVPWGGAFNPAITTLDLNNVQRIEVLKGAAPVMYGATSFVGVVQVLHYPAGEASNEADVAVGNHGSARGSASFVLPQWGDYRQSFAADGQSVGFTDRRENVSDGRLLYRGALDMGTTGKLSVDANLSIVRDVPTSPVIREGTALTNLTPIDANFNPADAAINEDRYQLAVSYSRPTSWGTWDTLVSIARSHVDDIRAFLHPDLSGDADTQNQNRTIVDDYFDTHLASERGDVTLLAGADLLYGYGRQVTMNGNTAYTVPLDGSVLPPPTTQLPVNELGFVADKRLFAGQYIQLDWKPDARWDLIAAARLNETRERKFASDSTLSPFSATDYAAESASRDVVRPTETVGASYRAWAQGQNELVLFADYRNAFKPAALDFGPDYQPAVLRPETTKSYEVGLKGAAADGRLAYQVEAFRLDFNNLVVSTESGFLTNAGGEQLKGVELEARVGITDQLVIAGNYTYHNARFTQYLFFDPDAGSYVDVAGKQLPLSSHHLASAGLLYQPPQGINSTLIMSYVGRRFLDEQNLAPVGGYTKVDATLGYRLGHYQLTVEGANLTNQRPPVTASEFGSGSFYLLNARTLWLRLAYRS